MRAGESRLVWFRDNRLGAECVPYHRAVNGYVVTSPHKGSGVGSNLASLAGGLWLARRLGRTLLVDWRGQPDLADSDLNYFGEFLSLPHSLGGVEIVPVPAGPDPVAPEGSIRWLSPEEARALAAGTASVPPEEYLGLEAFHGFGRLHSGSESEYFRFLRTFYRALRPHPEIAHAVDDWVATAFSEFTFVIGLHVRTGNGSSDFAPGGPFSRRFDTRLFDDEQRLLRLLTRACERIARRFPPQLRTNAAVFYTTDSAAMNDTLARLPNAFTRRTVFPPAGIDHAYAFSDPDYTSRDGVVDTLTDLFLLARCDGLAYSASVFNEYARVMTGNFGGNEVLLQFFPLRDRSRDVLQRVRRRLR